jgi:DNA-binding response OmpR family regulator
MDHTILICDDETPLRELVRVSLGPEYRFLEAHDGATAVALARRELPDLLVVDLMLPVVSGLDVVEELRADPALASVPVLVVSAWSQSRDAALAAGADRFVSKPFDPAELAEIVKELLER